MDTKEIKRGIDKLGLSDQRMILTNELKMIRSILEMATNKERDILKRLRELRQVTAPKVSIRTIQNGKYLVANARVGNQVASVYLGAVTPWGDKWRTNRKLQAEAERKMKIKLQEKLEGKK